MAEPTFPSFTKTHRVEAYPAIDPTQPKLSCKGLTVAVTGGGSGIGQAIALAFARAKADNIALLGRTESTLNETADKIKSTNSSTNAFSVTADITNAESVKAAFDKIHQTFSAVPDILINNAGGNFATGSVDEIDLANFWKTYELNVLGTMTVDQKYIQLAQSTEQEKAKPRTIIHICSGSAHIPYMPTAVGYSSSKLAVAKISEYVHFEHRDWRVFNMQPGVVATELAKRAGRAGETEPEVPAHFAVWLARDPRAPELNGRFLWANWDVDELLEQSQEINEKALLFTGIKGWAEGYDADSLRDRLARVTAKK